MQDWSDNLFDEAVADALRSAVVTPQQRRRAWERLAQSAAHQTMLPPLAAPERPLRRLHPMRQALRLGGRALDWGLSLLFDDTRYDRALRCRHACASFALLESPLRNMMGGVAT